MPERDIFHDAVKNALVKEGWTITDDPLFLEFGGVDMYVDLGAEKLVAAEKDGQKIAVEVKGFVGASIISEFHRALGQLMNYRLALNVQNPERVLYLAVPLDIYESFFMLVFGQTAIQSYQLKLIVYDEKKEVIIKWLN
jgi:hypothetical protein